MASRDIYETTVTASGAGGALVPMAGVLVYVVPRGGVEADVNQVTVFQSDVGITQGPDPKSGATGVNPFTTGATGAVRFWANGPAELDLIFKDTVAPARIDDRVGWNAMPAHLGSIPTSMLAEDGGLKLAHLAEEIKRQQMQVGMVDDFWRPASSVPPPAGFEICDGHQVNSHDFPGIAGPINVPDLRNVFILGADPTKAHGAGATVGNGPANAPGIAGVGGSNAARSFAHGHGVPGVDHLHLTTAPDHLHGAGALYTGNHSHGVSVTGNTGNGNRGQPFQLGGGAEAGAYLNHSHGVAASGGTDLAGNIGVGGTTGAADRSLAAWSGAADRSLNTATNSTTWTGGDPSGDFRPAFVGLLRIIKVKKS